MLEGWRKRNEQIGGGEKEDEWFVNYEVRLDSRHEGSRCSCFLGKSGLHCLSIKPATNTSTSGLIYAFFLWENQPLYAFLGLPELCPSPGRRAVPADIQLTGHVLYVYFSPLIYRLISLLGCSSDSTMRLDGFMLNDILPWCIQLWPEIYFLWKFSVEQILEDTGRVGRKTLRDTTQYMTMWSMGHYKVQV